MGVFGNSSDVGEGLNGQCRIVYIVAALFLYISLVLFEVLSIEWFSTIASYQKTRVVIDQVADTSPRFEGDIQVFY